MSWLLPAIAALVFFVWLGRKRGGEWRAAAGVVAAALFTGAAFAGLRNQWVFCAALLTAGSILAVGVRQRAVRSSVEAARGLLGVGEDATEYEIRAAHRRLMREAHPDVGGDDHRASALNAARDRLLKLIR